MIAILVAKWVADSTGKESVYDLTQTVLDYPFLDLEHARQLVRRQNALVDHIIPQQQTMTEIKVHAPLSDKVRRKLLDEKLEQPKRRVLMDAGLVLAERLFARIHCRGRIGVHIEIGSCA
jgi:chloride channel 3/4/5